LIFKETFVHPAYLIATKENNIALIQLKSPIKEFTTVIKPACLATSVVQISQTFIIR
jgi:hypothetical protein